MPLGDDVRYCIIQESQQLRMKAQDYLWQDIMASFTDIIEDIVSRKMAYMVLEHQIQLIRKEYLNG